MLKFAGIDSNVATGLVVASLLLVARASGVAQAAPFPYVNDFSSTGLTNAAAEFTLDAGNGVLNYVSGGGIVVSTASEPITGIGTSDFIVSTRFTVNSVEGGPTNISVGFGVFGTSSTFASSDGDSLYLVDWSLFGGTPGALRILAQGDTTDVTAVNSDVGAATAGNTYELRLTGTYSSGALNMSLEVLDGVGTPIGTAATATDASPLTGQFFGYRNRTANASHAIDLSFDNFSIGEPTSAVPGDFDGDGDVDGADFVVWQTNFPTAMDATLADGDADGDGDVDGADFVVWQTNFPTTPSPGVSPVPEPHSVLLSAIGIAGLGLLVRRRRK